MTTFSSAARPVRLLLLFLFFAVEGLAIERVQFGTQPGWLEKKPDLISSIPAAKLISSGYYVVLSEHQINVGKQSEYTHIIRHVVNETGVQVASEISVNYSPAYQRLLIHEVKVTRNGSVVNQLKPGDFKIMDLESDTEDFQYSGMKRAVAVLKDIRRDDRIEYAYSLTGFNPVFKNKYSGSISFLTGIVAVNTFQALIAPGDRNFYFKHFNGAEKPVESRSGNDKVYRWANVKSDVWQSQPGVPSWFDNFPYILISEYENWEKVVEWGLEAYDNYSLPLSPEIKEQTAKWRKIAAGDNDVFASLALRFVQDEIRYLGMEIGINTHRPHTPAEVFKQRFGDCKDKAFLLASILQHENIPAYAALVNTELRNMVIEDIPSPTAFDHVILAVERNKEFFFVDPTVANQRGEFVNTFIEPYGYALVIKSGENKLQKVEPGYLNEIAIKEVLDVRQEDTSSFRVVTVYSGGKADRIRQTMTEYSAEDLDQEYLSYYNRTYDDIEKAGDIELSDDSAGNKFTIRESYKIPKVWQDAGEGAKNIPVFAKAIYLELPDPADTYKNGPIDISYPLHLSYTITVNMPSTFFFPIEEMHVDNDSYKFDFRTENTGSVLRFVYSFKTYKDHIATSDLAMYKKDYKKIMSVVNFSINTKGFSGTKQINDGAVNWLMLIYLIAVGVGFSFLIRFLNSRSLGERALHDYGYYTHEDIKQPLNGWLIFLAVTIGLAGLVSIYNFVSTQILSVNIWEQAKAFGGTGFQAILVVDSFFRLFWICSSIALLYWLLQRRDIFPQMFLWFAGSLVTGNLILTLLYATTNTLPDTLLTQKLYEVARSFIYAFCWGTYILQSTDVKRTFVRRA